jgi:hypothetical protein
VEWDGVCMGAKKKERKKSTWTHNSFKPRRSTKENTFFFDDVFEVERTKKKKDKERIENDPLLKVLFFRFSHFLWHLANVCATKRAKKNDFLRKISARERNDEMLQDAGKECYENEQIGASRGQPAISEFQQNCDNASAAVMNVFAISSSYSICFYC